MNRAILNTAFLTITLSAATFAQISKPPLKPVTVCEVLMDQQAFNGKNVTVIGRYVDTSQGRRWLNEDACDRTLDTNGFVWPNQIWIECCKQPAPEPPTGWLRLDEPTLIEKLAQLRKSTKLQTRSEKLYESVNGKFGLLGTFDVKDIWAVAFGRIETKTKLETVVVGNEIRGVGFGHLNTAPVQLVIGASYIRFIKDEEYPTPSK